MGMDVDGEASGGAAAVAVPAIRGRALDGAAGQAVAGVGGGDAQVAARRVLQQSARRAARCRARSRLPGPPATTLHR